jgi:Ca2+-dependent lipid-binding protein
VIKNTLDPSWAEKEMSLTALANGDRQRSLRFTVWDWNASGKPDLIGAFETSVERLEAGQLTYQVGNFS